MGRHPHRHPLRRASPSVGAFAIAGLAVLLGASPAAHAEPVAVRFIEGVTRGYLVVHALDGKSLGQGDLTQLSRNGRVESRMVLRFHDGSLHDEEVVFTQNKVFALVSFKLTQRGPSFPTAIEATMTGGSGEYVVRARTGDRDKEYRGRLDLPPDISNGLPIVLLRNLSAGQSASVHIVAWTPAPRLIGLDIVPAGEDPTRVGEETRRSRRFELRPKLSLLLKMAAKVLGKMPPNQHCWVMADPVPAFVACEAPLAYDGPTWRIGVVSPTRRATTGSPR